MSDKPLQLDRAETNGWVVLIGGGEFSFGETEEIDRFLLERLPADRRTIAFLPTASGSSEYAGHFAKYISGLAPDVRVVSVPIYRIRDARRGKNLDLLTSAGMVYIGGGVTNRLLAATNQEPFTAALKMALRGGSIVAGIGAGAAALGVVARDMETEHRSIPALGIVFGAAVESGFDPAQDSMLRRLMSLPNVTVGVGIPRSCALAIDGSGAASVLGNRPIAVVRKRV
ncbi:MAG TPA: Type 1 glutamine amidotransferase-like domain-containing protein [Thermoanaerobaculia bacterium]|nr:Type 1 glutamine amidotransferase-like domain-containing protein [Thermoanaerobaculia bacterium]